MTTEHSTYMDEGGVCETVTLKRGPATPHGHALLKIEYGNDEVMDCYVNTAWLRDRLDDLEPHLLAPAAITDEMVDRAMNVYIHAEGSPRDAWRAGLTAALAEPPARPEGAEKLAEVIDGLFTGDEGIYADDLADSLARCGVRVVAGKGSEAGAEWARANLAAQEPTSLPHTQ